MFKGSTADLAKAVTKIEEKSGFAQASVISPELEAEIEEVFSDLEENRLHYHRKKDMMKKADS